MTDEVKKLLDAEQAMAKMLVHVKGLKAQMEKHASAQESLEAVQASLTEFIEQSHVIVEGIGRAIRTMIEMDMPALMGRMDEFRADLDRATSELSQSFNSMGTAMGRTLTARIDETMIRIHREVVQILEAAEGRSSATIIQLSEKFSAELLAMTAGVQAAVAAEMINASAEQAANLRAFGTAVDAATRGAVGELEPKLVTGLASVEAEFVRARTKSDLVSGSVAKLSRVILIQNVVIGCLVVVVAAGAATQLLMYLRP